MKRTNLVRVRDTFKACMLGLVAGMMGWCIVQPSAALALKRGIVDVLSTVFTGPFVAHDAPTLAQLATFAWAATTLISGVVFLSFFLAAAVAAYLILEWAGRSK